ncbi:MAG: recombinase XerC, partial [Dehalococcoidia bacterium]
MVTAPLPENYLDGFLSHLQTELNLSPRTVRNYINDIQGNFEHGAPKGFFQYLEIRHIKFPAEVDKYAIRGYMAWLLEQGVAKNSVARKLSAIRSLYRYLLREEMISESPMPVARKHGGRLSAFSLKLDRRLPSFLTIDEVERLLNAPDSVTPIGLRDRAIMELLYAAGLRISELTSLQLDQVDFYSRELRVLGKGSKERLVLIGHPATAAIKLYLKNGRSELMKDKEPNQALFV